MQNAYTKHDRPQYYQQGLKTVLTETGWQPHRMGHGQHPDSNISYKSHGKPIHYMNTEIPLGRLLVLTASLCVCCELLLLSSASCASRLPVGPWDNPTIIAHNEVRTGTGFSHCWPFVRGIHRSAMDRPHKVPIMYSSWCFLWSQNEQKSFWIYSWLSVIWH